MRINEILMKIFLIWTQIGLSKQPVPVCCVDQTVADFPFFSFNVFLNLNSFNGFFKFAFDRIDSRRLLEVPLYGVNRLEIRNRSLIKI